MGSQVWNPWDLVQSLAIDTGSGRAKGKKRVVLRLVHPPERSGLCPGGSRMRNARKLVLILPGDQMQPTFAGEEEKLLPLCGQPCYCL